MLPPFPRAKITKFTLPSNGSPCSAKPPNNLRTPIPKMPSIDPSPILFSRTRVATYHQQPMAACSSDQTAAPKFNSIIVTVPQYSIIRQTQCLPQITHSQFLSRMLTICLLRRGRLLRNSLLSMNFSILSTETSSISTTKIRTSGRMSRRRSSATSTSTYAHLTAITWKRGEGSNGSK